MTKNRPLYTPPQSFLSPVHPNTPCQKPLLKALVLPLQKRLFSNPKTSAFQSQWNWGLKSTAIDGQKHCFCKGNPTAIEMHPTVARATPTAAFAPCRAGRDSSLFPLVGTSLSVVSLLGSTSSPPIAESRSVDSREPPSHAHIEHTIHLRSILYVL